MRQILTLQVGEYANQTGSYYWDTEKKKLECYVDEKRFREEDFDILFSNNFSRGTRYVPRLVRLGQKDLKFASNRSTSASGNGTNVHLADKGIESAIARSWDREVERLTPDKLYVPDSDSQTPSQESTYSHCSGVYYQDEHPNSLCELPFSTGYELGSNLSYFSQGYEFVQEKSSWLVDELLDKKIRYFAEDSDCLQGFQIFGDLGTAMTGVTSALIKEIRDQYPKCGILNVGLKKPLPESSDKQQKSSSKKPSEFERTDEALFIGSLLDDEMLNVLLKQPKSFDRDSPYAIARTSSVNSIILESLLLPVRLSQVALDLKDLFSVVTGGEKRWFSSVAASIPLNNEDLSDLSMNNLSNYLKPFGPHSSVPLSELYGSVLVSRGVVRQLVASNGEDRHVSRICLSDEYICEQNRRTSNMSCLLVNSLPLTDSIKCLDTHTENGLKSIVCLSSGKSNSSYLNDLLNSLNTTNIIKYAQAAGLSPSTQLDMWSNTRVSIEDMMDLYV